MANQSILAAFERMWQHIVFKLGDKVGRTELDEELATINTELDGSINSLSVSGQTITYTKNDGTTGTITTQDTNTDTKVTQTATTNSGNFPILLRGTSAGTTTTTTTTSFGTGVTVNPSTKTVTATTFVGDLSGTANVSIKAEQDGNSNIITSTYETKSDAQAKLVSANEYTDGTVNETKNELLDGADESHNTLKKLGDLITTNSNSISSLETMGEGKVNYTDIVNNLTTNSINKALSAAQGVTIKSSIEDLSAEVSELKLMNNELSTLSETVSNHTTEIVLINKSVGDLEDELEEKTQVQIITWEDSD